jgi:hypothetical protein
MSCLTVIVNKAKQDVDQLLVPDGTHEPLFARRLREVEHH